MTPELKEMSLHPAIQQMTLYSFIGNKETVKEQIKVFLDQTQVDEVIAASSIHNPTDRIHSYKLFAEIMKELNNN